MAGLFKGVGKLAGGLFGASQAPKQPKFDFFPNITTPSFNLKTSAGGNIDLTRVGSPQRFPDILKQLSDLSGQVRPGFGRFTEAAVKSLRRAKGDALGTAREQLQRRRVQGSSFANASLAKIEEQFGVTEAKLRGQALLQEIDTTFRLIDAEATTKTRNFEFELKELGIATSVATSLVQVISDQTIIDKKIAAEAAAGAGEFFGDIGSLIGEGFGSLFGGGADISGGGGDDDLGGNIGGDLLGSLASKLFF